MPHRILLGSGILYLLVSNVIWIARDTRPPFWDMAVHQTTAIRFQDALAEKGASALASIPSLSGFYPPLYPAIAAVFFSIFGRSEDSAQAANFPAIVLLALATYGIGLRLLSRTGAAAAALAVSFMPMTLWLSRETLIEYWLVAWVALAVYLLLESGELSDRNRSLAFGAVCGLGMLTKWTFALFLIGPYLRAARRHPRNAIIAAVLAAAVAAYWYVPQFSAMGQLLAINNAGGLNEGDPNRLSPQALIFYIRALAGYQLFPVLFGAFLAGLFLLMRNWDSRWAPIALWIGCGWLALLAFQNKDPRYSAPLLPAVGLILARIVDARPFLTWVLIPFLLFQHYLVSFGIRQLPVEVVLVPGVQGPIAWNWNLYTQSYMGLWGRPARENWKIQDVLNEVSGEPPHARPVRLGIIPDIPRFDSFAFDYYIARDRKPVTITRLWTFDESAILGSDYVLYSENDQGFTQYFTKDIPRINQFILERPERFQPVDWFTLPNGAVIRLYKVVS